MCLCNALGGGGIRQCEVASGGARHVFILFWFFLVACAGFSHQLIGQSVENIGSKGIYLFLMLFSEGYLFLVEPQALQNIGEG